jgi:hypothetical protein
MGMLGDEATEICPNTVYGTYSIATYGSYATNSAPICWFDTTTGCNDSALVKNRFGHPVSDTLSDALA